MLYYFLSILALLCWSGSDLFSKKGTCEQDKNSHWKVVFAVGSIMGLHFFITLIGGAVIDNTVGVDKLPKIVASLLYTDFKLTDFINYLPIAFLYILAMVLGYIGLRYIELSISSPICNSSGALAFLLCVVFGIFSKDELTPTTIIGISMITVGIVALGFIEQREDVEIKKERRQKANRKYTKSILAFLLPLSYLVIDALGTVGDEYIASDKFISNPENFKITDYAANSAFELTFFILAIFAFVWLKFVKKDSVFSGNKNLFLGGLCETVGQVFYMAVMFSDFSVGMVIISSYCAISVLWSRIFLKEKMSWKHYSVIALVIAGIVILG